MADEIKAPKEPTAAELQAKANAEAAEVYKKAVNSKFTNGKQVAKVLQYVPSRLTGPGPRQCFLVNYGNPNCSFFLPCKEFMEDFKPFVEGESVVAPVEPNNLPH